MFNTEHAEDTGMAIGYLLLDFKKNHDRFWIKLQRNTSQNIFDRIQLMIVVFVSALCGFIYYHSWTFIFGPLTPVTFPVGLIKFTIYGTTSYIFGFELGFNWVYYITKMLSETIHIEYDTEFPVHIDDDLPKSLKVYTYEVEKIQKPLKKRRNSESEINKKKVEKCGVGLSLHECDDPLTCGSKKNL